MNAEPSLYQCTSTGQTLRRSTGWFLVGMKRCHNTLLVKSHGTTQHRQCPQSNSVTSCTCPICMLHASTSIRMHVYMQATCARCVSVIQAHTCTCTKHWTTGNTSAPQPYGDTRGVHDHTHVQHRRVCCSAHKKWIPTATEHIASTASTAGMLQGKHAHTVHTTVQTLHTHLLCLATTRYSSC